ncbi:MAG: 50S ribosomal protein L23 [Bernardetiaceae bacterium]|nr:50S ribosomal protein L23 [Bernardetiaceae bacterium]
MEVLKRPLVTEKTSQMHEKGVYTFKVQPKATKEQIKSAIEEMYADEEIQVVSVRTANYLGKPKSRYTKRGVSKGRTPEYKKAYVQLAEGQMIDIYGEEEEA